MSEQRLQGGGSILEIEGLSKRFGGLVALQDVSLAVRQGTIHSVIGPNGAGKTCLFNCASGHYAPDAGTVRLAGLRIDGLAPNRVAKAGMARTFQNIRLFKSLTAIENVLVGVDQREGVGMLRSLLGGRDGTAQQRVARARGLLDLVGLRGRGDILARNLSYGDQRRLEIARALAIQPLVLLLDEPAAGMNPVESLELMTLIRTIRDQVGATILLIEHEMRVVMSISDRVTVLDRGRLLVEGTPSEIRSDLRVIESYLGTGAAARAMLGTLQEARSP